MESRNSRISVTEVFLSLQGEGLYAGEPTVFIRFAGCNLLVGCRWCDTKYSQRFEDGKLMEIKEIMEKVRDLAPHYKFWVCISGGEPLAQPQGLEELVRGLKSWGYRVEIETNGTIKKPQWYTLADCWVADIKCPSSGVVSLEKEWFDTRGTDQVKLVVSTKEDLDYAREVINRNRARSPKVIVSPVVPVGEVILSEINRRWLQEVWGFCMDYRVRFSYQLHKLTFGNRKGV